MNLPKVKYCGNQSLEDLQNTIHSRAEYLGLVFAKSKRQVNPEEVASWLNEVTLKKNQRLVGLFVNPETPDIKKVLQKIPLDIIQCHGTESRERVREIAAISGLPVWKVVHHDENAFLQMKTYEGAAAGFVIDCKVKGQWGGTGKTFDWREIPNYLNESRKIGVPCWIAGGIHIDNIAELMLYRPEGIDLSSGIETNGRKDRAKISRFEERMDQVERALS